MSRDVKTVICTITDETYVIFPSCFPHCACLFDSLIRSSWRGLFFCNSFMENDCSTNNFYVFDSLVCFAHSTINWDLPQRLSAVCEIFLIFTHSFVSLENNCSVAVCDVQQLNFPQYVIHDIQKPSVRIIFFKLFCCNL